MQAPVGCRCKEKKALKSFSVKAESFQPIENATEQQFSFELQAENSA
jgi:hypothetical protein